jgi:hypothetical protein
MIAPICVIKSRLRVLPKILETEEEEKKEKIISENNTWTKELDEILNAKDSLKKLHPANNEEE